MIITLIGANFANSNIGTLSTWRISTVLGAGASSSNSATSVDRESNTGYTTTITIAEGYELGAAGITVTMGGVDITSTAVSGLTITIPTKVTGNVVIKVPTKNTATGEEEEPENPGGGGTTTVDYGTLISSPTNLRGGAVEYIIVKPEFYTSILNKKITKIRVYKVADSSDASKTTIGIGKVALSGNFASASQTVSGLATAYSNISSYKTYNVASYTNKTMMELDCDITLSNGEYLCFETKNGHCVGYCNDAPQEQQMLYVYSGVVCPEGGAERSQQLPISVTVEE